MNIKSLGHVQPSAGIRRYGGPPSDTTAAGDADVVAQADTQAGEFATTHGHETAYKQPENGFTRTRTKTLHDGRILSKTIAVERTVDGVPRTVTVINPNGKTNTTTSVLLDGETFNQLVGIEISEQEEEAATTESVVTTVAAIDRPATVDPATVDGAFIDALLEELLADGEEEQVSDGELPGSLIV